MRTQLGEGWYRACGRPNPEAVGTSVVEYLAVVSLSMMAIEQFRSRPPLVSIRILHPFAQQIGNLGIRSIALALVNIGRGMVGIGRSSRLHHRTMGIVGCAVDAI